MNVGSAINVGVSVPQTIAPAVYNRSKILPILLAAFTERCVCVSLGDSNEEKDGTGNQCAIALALDLCGGTWGTGIKTEAGTMFGWGNAKFQSDGTTHVLRGAPSQVEDYFQDDQIGGMPPGYVYVPAGQTCGNAQFFQITQPYCYWMGDQLRCHLGYMKFPGGAGSFKPYAYSQAQGVIGNPGTVSLNGTGYDIGYSIVDVAANTTRIGNYVEFGAGDTPNGGIVTGPAVFHYQEIERVNFTRGWSHTSLMLYGGHGLIDYDTSLATFETNPSGPGPTLARAKQYLTNITRLANTTSTKTLWIINSGPNDRSDLRTSRGPAAIAGDGGPWFADNMLAIINRIKGWVMSWGGDVSKHYFLLVAGHTQDPKNGIDAKIQAYNDACDTLSDQLPNCAALHFSRLVSAQEQWDWTNWLQQDADPHMTLSGYARLWRMAMKAMLSGKAPSYAEEFAAESARLRVYNMVTAATLANSTTATTLINGTASQAANMGADGPYPYYYGFQCIPQAFFRKPRTFRVRASGFYSTLGSAQGTFQLKLIIGTTAVIDTGAITPPAGATNGRWTFEADIACGGMNSGNTISLLPGGELRLGTSVFPSVSTGYVQPAMTYLTPFDLTGQWSVANAGNTITCQTFTLEATG